MEQELNPQQKYEALLAEFEAARRNRETSVDDMLRLARDVNAAKGAALAFVSEQNRAAREAAVASIFEQVKSLIQSVDWASVSVTAIQSRYDVETQTFSLVPTVPGVSRAKSATAGAPREGKSRKVYTLDGVTYSARELVAAKGPEVNQTRTDTVLADSSKGLSHFADEIAKKLGASVA